MRAHFLTLLWPLMLTVISVLMGALSCTPIRPGLTELPFRAPAPVSKADASPESSTEVPSPPSLPPTIYTLNSPLLSSVEPLSRKNISAARYEDVLRQAELSFAAGRRHYQAGQIDLARNDFDKAIKTLLETPEGLTSRPAIQRKFSEMVDEIYQFDVSGLGAGGDTDEPVFEGSPLDEIPELTFPVDPSQRNKITEEIRATASQLPLTANDEVLRYVTYFSSGRGKKILLSGLRRAGRYRPLIQRILDEECLPQELIHLAQAESGFFPRAFSRKKAGGMWQFMLSRGRQYGLEKTVSVDERLDPEKATRAAARHLRDLYAEFGDWYLAMAAYNCGPLNVQRAIERTGYADFWELARRGVLPKETVSYVPVILAMIIIAKNPAAHGIENVESEPPLEYSTVELEAPTHLALIADILECPIAEIRDLNPALLKDVAPAGYSLRVPKGKNAVVVSALGMIHPSQRASWRLHRVREGDSVASIAARYKVAVNKLVEINQLDGKLPAEGSLLVIPAAPYHERVLAKRPARVRPTVTSRTRTASRHSPKRRSARGVVVASKRPLASRHNVQDR